MKTFSDSEKTVSVEAAPTGRQGEAVRRLTALWALSEAGLGGAMHALRLPLTGLFVGGSAVLFLTLLAWTCRRHSAAPARVLLRATAIVLAVKAAASPHSPVGAYVAVAFQGAAGAVLFSALPGLRVPAMLLGGAALLESCVQKLLMLALFFGKPLGEAIDEIGRRLLPAFGVEGASFSLTLWLAVGFAGVYLVAGLMIGYLAGRLPARAVAELRRIRAEDGQEGLDDGASRLPTPRTPSDDASAHSKRRWYWGAFLAVLAVTYALVGSGGGPWHRAAYVLTRTLGAVALWYVLVGPLLRAALSKVFRRSEQRYAAEVERTVQLLPELRRLTARTWREVQCRERSRSRRLVRFAALLVARMLLVPACSDAAPTTSTPEKVADAA